MFYEVHVKEEHRDFLCFLWWEDGNTAEDPAEYRMMVHLFGATPHLVVQTLPLNAPLKTTSQS